MGVYLNPGNIGFQEILNSEYVDKTGMIRLINETIDTKRKLVCVSRPRRFGKSFAAQMLCAYYGKGCDSRELFSGLAIENEPSFADYLNKYDVIYLDMTGIIGEAGGGRFIDFIKEKVTEELKEAYPALKVDSAFTKTLANAVELNHNKFIVIIDEWDAPIRELPGMESAYLDFLRTLFKNSGTTAKLFSAAYMTGILPIKKNGSQSAISDFQEYTMIRPGPFGEYVGFTEAEVKELCDKHGADFSMMKQWYDGYYLKNTGSVYNPNSVMSAIREEDYYSYWTESAAASGLMEYISKDYNGLTKTIAELIGGLEVKVDTLGFGNDPSSFRGKDDVLTLLVHYGYLAYDASKKTVRIPNEEIRLEFQRSVREVPHEATRRRVAESDKLFHDTIAGDEEAVAAQVEKIHAEETSPLHYNREDSLRSVIKLAYYTYRDHYLQWEELPAGEGFADIVYLPKRDCDWPALLIELKWNKSAQGAIDQILQKKYPDALKGLESKLLLVGINYDSTAPAGEKKHTCKIRHL